MELADLKKIGLTQGEIKIYSALLEIGETTRTELAKKSGISPSKIYDVANRLLEKGIISIVKKGGIIHFSAANPERLKDFIELKETEIKKEKEVVEKMLPLLLSKYEITEHRADIDVFYGWGGMKTVFNDIARTLGKGDTNYVFGASQGRNEKQADVFFSQYYTKMEEKGYKTKIIFNEEVRKNKERTNYFVKSKRHEARFLHQETFTEINLYRDTVLFIMLLSKPIVVRIRNKEAADSFRKFFDILWNQAKP
ncbi:MAG: helix-turn-helix domain-containing protein [Nanoarchaeota archaeon]|nr:helix-turn-helix domain-containing protein [Nanoarchaeota archaeon]MBU0977981.1 helix-turn-helix domain-containing protein [Nanoarchaeota archaeon]